MPTMARRSGAAVRSAQVKVTTSYVFMLAIVPDTPR